MLNKAADWARQDGPPVWTFSQRLFAGRPFGCVQNTKDVDVV